jgi:hypothetical protein
MQRMLRWLCLPGLLACSTGCGHADFDLKQVPGTAVFESEQDFATTVIDGRYRLFNNAWNRGASSGRHHQKIFVHDDNGKTIFGWMWRWKDSTGVATYPEVQVGVSPWNGEAASGSESGFPFTAGSKKLVVDYDITLEASGSYNLAFEFWVAAGLPPSKDTITHEVMIWIAGERLGAAGSEVGKLTLQGTSYGVNLQKNHGDASGASANTWTILSFLADKPVLHGPLDLGQIIDWLLKNGYVTTKHYITNLELGDEVQRGTGTTIVRNYAVRVE